MTDSGNFGNFIINITMKCNENTFAYIILLKLPPIVNVFLVCLQTITLDICFVRLKYGYSDHDLT